MTSNLTSEPSFQQTRQAPVSATRRMAWLIRREFWENRSIILAPLAAATLALLGFLLSVPRLAARLRFASALDPIELQGLLTSSYTFASLLIMATAFLVALYYCLDALHRERLDRSILFWKSLPLSDLETVLSKASIPLFILPLIAFLLTAATEWIMLLVTTAVLLADGGNASSLWAHTSFLQVSLMLLYHLLLVHGLWYAPIYGWLLLVSAWARRAVFLWAVLPVLAIGVAEKIAFNTSHFAGMLANRIGGGPEGAPFESAIMAMHPLMQLTPLRFLISPGLWIGLAITAACLAGAVRLRHTREPI